MSVGWIALRLRNAKIAPRCEMDGGVKTTFSLMVRIVSTISGSAIMFPRRHPVIVKFLEKLLMVMVCSRIPGRLAKGTNGVWKLNAV